MLLNVFQSVADKVPVAAVPASAIVRAWPEIVRPFILFTSVTSPLFDPVDVPEKFVAVIAPVNVAPESFAYEVEAADHIGSVSVFTYAKDVEAESGIYVLAAVVVERYVVIPEIVWKVLVAYVYEGVFARVANVFVAYVYVG